jgi:protein required for attachment to host cells
MEDTDWHQRAEDKFVREIAAKIDALVRSAAITALVVAAPPKVLGELRNCMSQATKELIVGEIAKDMVKLPTAEIERHLAATGELR